MKKLRYALHDLMTVKVILQSTPVSFHYLPMTRPSVLQRQRAALKRKILLVNCSARISGDHLVDKDYVKVFS